MDSKIRLNDIGKGFVESLREKYLAEMSEAKSTLRLYTNGLSGIGEHSKITEEQNTWLQKYSDAKGKLDAINDLFALEDNING